MSDFALDPVTRGLVVKKGSFLAISGPEKVTPGVMSFIVTPPPVPASGATA